jgi:uncharacterized protein DUF4136
MKSFVVCCAVLALAAGAAAQTPKYGVKVEAEKNVDYAKFKTYTWTQGQPSPDKAIDSQIMAAVDRELAGLGMTKATSGAGDIEVAYYSVTRTDVNLKAKPDAKGLQPEISVGTLMVALLEPGSRKRLLRLRVDKSIDGVERAQSERVINAAVTEMFEQYPTRTKGKK